MSKLSQLIHFDALGIPTPSFTAVSYDDFRLDRYQDDVDRLQFPVIVRDDFQPAGDTFTSQPTLHEVVVERVALFDAIDRIFSAYPAREDQHVIIQTMISPDVKGELIVGKHNVWKLNASSSYHHEGTAEAEISIFLPRFSRSDYQWAGIFPIWKPFLDRRHKKLIRPLIALSAYAGELLVEQANAGVDGLAIEFLVANNKTSIIQAQKVESEGEPGHILTAASHKEILPPQPSTFMSGMIASCSKYLFSYYQRLDPSLPNSSFIELTGGMPWINLSSILDVMVHWGLPTNLITRSVGSTDVYQVKTRPYRAIRKLPVFIRVLKDQLSVTVRSAEWSKNTLERIQKEVDSRASLWNSDPDIAYTNWLTQVQLTYVELVDLMQTLTGAISGPIRLLEKWGILQNMEEEGQELAYLTAFRQLLSGKIQEQEFIEKHGHRGFYESDIGQRRFSEFTHQEWNLMKSVKPVSTLQAPSVSLWRRAIISFLDPISALVHSRTTLRDEGMRMFQLLRGEMITQSQKLFGAEFDFAAYQPDTLARGIDQNWGPGEWKSVLHQEITGWDRDLFLSGQSGIRNELHKPGNNVTTRPIGIVAGVVRGQLWKVDCADPAALKKPQFESTILLTESLDPGWIPFLLQVNGVLSYIGGILSPASAILREIGVPSVMQVLREEELETGDWIEMNGKTGEIRRITAPIDTIRVEK